MFKGLDKDKVKNYTEICEFNIVTEAKPKTFMSCLKNAFKEPLVILLLIVSAIMIVSAVIGGSSWLEPVLIVGSVLIVAVVSAKVDMAVSDKYDEELKYYLKNGFVNIHRNNEIVQISIHDLRVEDTLILKDGTVMSAENILLCMSGNAW